MNDEGGRRLADQVARWSTAAASMLAAALLSMVVFFYGGLPDDIAQLRDGLNEIHRELAVMKVEQRELIDANRVNQNWRERLIEIEKKADRHADTLGAHERRLDRLEDPRRSGRP